MNNLPRHLRITLFITWVLGAGLILLALRTPGLLTPLYSKVHLTTFVLVLGLSVLSEFKPMPVPGGKIQKVESLTIALLLFSVYVFGRGLAVMLAVASVGIADLARRKPYYKALFNAALYAGATTLAGIVFESIGRFSSLANPLTHIGAGFVAGSLFYAFNLTLLMTVIAQVEGGNFLQMVIWGFGDSAMINFGLIAVGIAMSMLWKIHPAAAAILLPPILLARMGYEAALARLRLQETREKTAALVEENRRIQEASRMKSEFVASMSHELRTPLNAIIGFSELLRSEKAGPLNEEQREFLGDVLSSARHLLGLISDVLDLAKVEAGRMEFRPKRAEVEQLVLEVRDIIRPLASEKNLSLHIEVQADLGPVFLDPSRFQQVLYNYLSNAIKFTPAAGTITVRVTAEGPEKFRLEVEDTGIGMKAEDMSRLFVDFQQLEAGMAKRSQGTGLGLALTKRIVEAQGGSVGVRSVVGKGSTFWAVLPRVQPGMAAEALAGGVVKATA